MPSDAWTAPRLRRSHWQEQRQSANGSRQPCYHDFCSRCVEVRAQLGPVAGDAVCLYRALRDSMVVRKISTAVANDTKFCMHDFAAWSWRTDYFSSRAPFRRHGVSYEFELQKFSILDQQAENGSPQEHLIC